MDWAAVGGSKADGTVVLGIDVPPKIGVSETIVQWDAAKANSEADRRCRNWGMQAPKPSGENSLCR
jgi:hypothetical protein